MEQMKKLVNPMLEREREFSGRPRAFDDLGAAIIHFEKILEQFSAGVRFEL